jgi:hypothetical protein
MKLDYRIPGSATVVICACLICAHSFCYPQSTYFVNTLVGSDSNSGLTEELAWRSMNRVNSVRLLPGDRLLFHRGQIWRDPLEISSLGSGNAPVYFGSYGYG